MNRVCLIGRLLADPKLFESGVVKGTIAMYGGKDRNGNQTSIFIPITAFNQTAELMNKYLKKGDRVGIEGHISCNTTIELKDLRIEVIVDKIDLIESKNNIKERAAESVNDDFGALPF